MHRPSLITSHTEESRLGPLDKVSLKVRTFLRAQKYRTKFEKQELEALFEFMPRDGYALDIGAYKGAWTYWMSQIAGERGKVVAFEPQKDAASLLRKTQVVMGWNNVRIEHSGVGAVNGTSPLFRGIHSGGMSQEANFTGGPGQASIGIIPMTTLDRYVGTSGIYKKVSFIKIDAEGYETSIIHGAREVIERDRPTIVVECDGNFIGEASQQRFFALMAECGYDGFFFTENGRKPIGEFDMSQHQRQDLPKGLSDPAYYNNFLFTPQK